MNVITSFIVYWSIVEVDHLIVIIPMIIIGADACRLLQLCIWTQLHTIAHFISHFYEINLILK